MSKFCSTCGSPIQPDQNVCPNCGTPTSNAVQQPQNYQQYPPNNYAQGHYAQQPYPQNNGNSGLKIALIVLASLLGIVLIGLLIWFIVGTSKAKEEGQQEQINKIQQEQTNLKASNDSLKQALEEEKNKPKTVVKNYVKGESRHHHSVSPANATRVVINGRGVRMRTGPGFEYGFPTTSSGRAYTVSKGTSLPFLGQYGNWYAVLFEGNTHYVSADFAYLR